VTRGEPRGLAKRFIDFASSPAVDDLVHAQYFVVPTR
jgi:phosphate transport system substrate-binding protein